MQASDRCGSLRAISSNIITRTTVVTHVVSVRLSSWTEVKESYFGLERTWSRFLNKAEEKPSPNDERSEATDCKSHVPKRPLNFVGMQDIFENGNWQTDRTG